ncbi:MAG: pilus assembly protein [Ilumatobacter sp.]|jgi:Flp pilus assembly protein TadG|uniref:TadE family protein n=1 Tax=Ilumatobacter sp. TaxID=1967498 RepID=UPI001DF6C03D|nr:pilus assembly protein [Ilumatobacter sp.]MBT5277353.1 pilus assembly protein [Ilumatobacter sp.]MBT5553737.1 pilus assembly protein [Ilumatobacter sp.]MBT5865624.1 pilus assembly protein [Ilumatobacter sp.]MBT7431126.1 pilus assembly protein [Ilumatobacter sp.]
MPGSPTCDMSGEAPSIIEASRTGSSQAGQATVEFALALPIVLIVLLGMTQVGVAIRNELAVELAAREGARAASVSASPQSAASAAAAAAVDLPIAVRTDVTATTVTVTVTYVDPTDVPIIGQFIGPSTHQATATMALEP